MDHPTDTSLDPHIPEATRTSVKMSTVTDQTVTPTSEAPTSMSSQVHPTTASQSSVAPSTSSKSEQTSPSPAISTSQTLSSTSEPHPPPTSTESSAELSPPTLSRVVPTTITELPSTATSIDPSSTTLISSITALPSSSVTATSSATPTLAPISPSGLPREAKLGLTIGLPVVFGVALIMGLVHYCHKHYQNTKENKKRVQDIEDQAQIAAFQAQMAQPVLKTPDKRASAMFGIYSSRFGDIELDNVQHSQRYQPYSKENSYRGW